MASNSQSCKRRGGQYCVAGRPNGESCKNGQCTEGKSIHEFPNKQKDTKRYQLWVKFVRRHRPQWTSTNSSVLCSDHFEESCFTKNRAIALQLGMKMKLKPDAIPTVDEPLLQQADEIDEDCSLTRRAKRQVRYFALVLKIL